jgi:hypothetical protein
MICTSDRGVETFTWAPTLVNGAAVLDTAPDMSIPTCDDAGATGALRRVVMQDARDTEPALSLRYWRDRTAADAEGTGDVEMVPAGALTAEELDLLTKVTIGLSDPSLGTPLEQTVVLANER